MRIVSLLFLWSCHGALGLRCVPSPRTRLPSMCMDPAAMSYRELQAACKSRGLRAAGKAVELRDRLLQHLGDSDDASSADEAPHTSAPVAPPAAPPLDENDDMLAQLLGDGAGTPTGAGAPTTGADDLFDELLNDLDEPDALPPGAYDAFGVYRQKPSAAAAETGGGSGGALAESGPLDGRVTDALDELDGGLGGLDLGDLGSLDDAQFADEVASLASLSGDDAVANVTETFDEAWLDELFGPLSDDVPPPPGSAPAADASAGGGPRAQRPPSAAGAWAQDKPESRRQWELPSSPRSDDPNEGLRRSLLSASSRGDHRKVLEMIGKWRRRGAPVDEPVYRSALIACADLGEWEIAAELINVMEEYGVVLGAVHFDNALRACDRKTRWQEALGLLERMGSYGLRPTARTFECSLRTCAKAGQDGMVTMLWERMREEQRASPPLEVSTRRRARCIARWGGHPPHTHPCETPPLPPGSPLALPPAACTWGGGC